MQESLFNTIQKLQNEDKINVEELEMVLQSDIEEVVKLCKKASLKPKTDDVGNAYFTKNDVNMLKKIKELYLQSKELQENTPQEKSFKEIQAETIKEDEQKQNLDSPERRINFLTKAKNRIKTQDVPMNQSIGANVLQLQDRLESFEKNIIDKMSAILSEKMDGFDEIIVELIRSKTENENLRQQVDSLNKQVFILKNELASFSPIAFGFYSKRESNDL